MKKNKARWKAGFMLLVVLLGLSSGAFLTRPGIIMTARAEEADETGAPEGGEDDPMEEPTPEGCTCEKRCGAYDYDHSCEVCAADYRLCEYKTPNVVVSIYQPSGWYTDSAEVTFSAIDAASTGNFVLVSLLAKIGQNGSWTDVTEDKRLTISENCTVYVQAVDQKGNTYERNKPIKCFDTVKPTLNAAVSDGTLTVHVSDTDSGPKAVFINGYKFTDLDNGVLSVRLQKFDAGYEYFTIYAMDKAGNTSEVYKTKNPYYTDPAEDDDKDLSSLLPSSAQATLPGSAVAGVTSHTLTDSNGNALTAEEQKKAALAQADETAAPRGSSPQGKEFYTIKTATDKVFYLIVDRDGEEEEVYFLTEITENDLLNVTSDNSETLPKNSAALESQIPVEESALPNNNGEDGSAAVSGGGAEGSSAAGSGGGSGSNGAAGSGGGAGDGSGGSSGAMSALAGLLSQTGADGAGGDGDGGDVGGAGRASGKEVIEGGEGDEDSEDGKDGGRSKGQESPWKTYVVIGVLSAAAIFAGYYIKVGRKKKDKGFVEDEDEEEEEDDDEVDEVEDMDEDVGDMEDEDCSWG